MRMNLINARRSGFTLLEVLIAVLVFSLGLLGVAGMMLTSVRGNHTAQLHTQATLLAQWMGDAMRANPVAVIAGNYNATATAGTPDACSTGCTPAQAATRDLTAWGSMIARSLPAGTGTVRCDLNSPIRPNDGVAAFPAGLCTVSLTWSEAQDAGKTSSEVGATTSAPKIQRYDWVINP